MDSLILFPGDLHGTEGSLRGSLVCEQHLEKAASCLIPGLPLGLLLGPMRKRLLAEAKGASF